jgi:hypothetical protein
LSAIFSTEKLQMDPLMFDMPLDTQLEICLAEDVATALVHAVSAPKLRHETLHIAGGEQCRTTFGEYVDTMMGLFGLGDDFLPREAFGIGPFHCGHMDTARSQEMLHYQQHSLADYYSAVEHAVRWRTPFFRLLRGPIRAYLLRRSPHMRAAISAFTPAARRRVRSGWFFSGTRAHQPM